MYEIMKKKYPDAAPQISVEPGVFLGEPFFADKGTYIGLPLGSDGHIIVVGGTGRGKTMDIEYGLVAHHIGKGMGEMTIHNRVFDDLAAKIHIFR